MVVQYFYCKFFYLIIVIYLIISKNFMVKQVFKTIFFNKSNVYFRKYTNFIFIIISILILINRHILLKNNNFSNLY